MQLKKEARVLKILRVYLEKVVLFKKILKFMKEKDKNVKDWNALGQLKKKFFQIDPLFFVIPAKNDQLFN